MSLYNAIPYRLLRIVEKKRHFGVFLRRSVTIQRLETYRRPATPERGETVFDLGVVRHHPNVWNVTPACNAVMIGNGIRFGGRDAII